MTSVGGAIQTIRPGLLVTVCLVIAAALGACDKTSGQGQKTAGHIESGVGSLTGDRHLQREGKKDEVVGGVKSAAGDIKDAVKDAAH